MTTAEPSARLTEGALVSRTLRFSLPLAFGMAAHGLFNCVDLVIVGRLGAGAVAAVTLGGVINMVAMLAYNGMANVLAGQAADLLGAGRRAELAALERASEKLTWIMSVVLGLGFAFMAKPLVDLAGADEATAALATRYLVICSLGSGTMFFVLWGASLLRARGESFWPMVVLVGSNALNLGLDFVLVFGLLGAPRMGVAGAAWATVISRALGAALLIVVVRRRRPSGAAASLGGPAAARTSAGAPTPEASATAAGSEGTPATAGALVREMILKGLVNSAQTIVRVIGLYLVLSMAARRAESGADELAARDLLDGVGVAIRLEMVLMFAALGFGAAAASFLAQNLAAERPRRARRGLGLILGEAVTTSVLLSGALWAFREPLFAMVAPGAATGAASFAALYFGLLLPAQPFLAAGIVLSQALVGLRSVIASVVVDTALYILLVPAILLASGTSPSGAFTPLAVAHGLGALVYVLVMRARLRRFRPDAAAAR